MLATLTTFAAFMAGGFDLQQFLITIVIVAAAIGLVLIFLRVAGIPIPPWFWNVVFIVIAAAVVICAIRFVFSL
jgi:hypothetical protein